MNRLIILAFALSACTTNSEEVINAAQSMGFKNVKTGDTAMRRRICCWGWGWRREPVQPVL